MLPDNTFSCNNSQVAILRHNTKYIFPINCNLNTVFYQLLHLMNQSSFNIVDYFSSLSDEIKQKSGLIAKSFSSHHLSSGQNKEKLVSELLKDYLPTRYCVDTGLIYDSNGNISRETDLLIADGLNNAPLFRESEKHLWFVEAVFAALEIKSKLTPSEFDNCLDKCRQFKRMERKFDELVQPRIKESLFIIWAFDIDSNETIKNNISTKISEIPEEERPDCIVVPGRLYIKMGQYRNLTEYGQEGSQSFLSNGHLKKQQDFENGIYMTFWDLGDNSVLVFLLYLLNWLKGAGQRAARLINYLPPNMQFGKEI